MGTSNQNIEFSLLAAVEISKASEQPILPTALDESELWMIGGGSAIVNMG